MYKQYKFRKIYIQMLQSNSIIDNILHRNINLYIQDSKVIIFTSKYIPHQTKKLYILDVYISKWAAYMILEGPE